MSSPLIIMVLYPVTTELPDTGNSDFKLSVTYTFVFVVHSLVSSHYRQAPLVVHHHQSPLNLSVSQASMPSLQHSPVARLSLNNAVVFNFLISLVKFSLNTVWEPLAVFWTLIARITCFDDWCHMSGFSLIFETFTLFLFSIKNNEWSQVTVAISVRWRSWGGWIKHLTLTILQTAP